MNFFKACGFLAVLAFLSFTALAVLNYANYSFAGQFLSELGIGENSAFWFNFGLMVAGVLFAVFFAGFFKKAKAVSMLGILASIALIGVGVFPLTQEFLHDLSVGLFFAFAGLAVLVFSLRRLRESKLLSLLGFAVFASVLALFALGLPLVQKLSVALFLLWVLIVSLKN